MDSFSISIQVHVASLSRYHVMTFMYSEHIIQLTCVLFDCGRIHKGKFMYIWCIYHKERFLDACDDLPIGVTHLKTKLQEHG